MEEDFLIRLLFNLNNDDPVVNCYSMSMMHYVVVTESNLESIQMAIDLGTSIDERDADGNTPLQVALRERVCRPDVIQLLLENGSDCNLRNYYYDYPLHTALKNIACPLGVIQLLLNYGARVNVLDYTGDTVLHTACISRNDNVEKVKLMLDNEANVDFENEEGDTPLLFALNHFCKFEIIQLLLDEGSDVQAENLDNLCPLQIAVRRSICDIRIVKLLLDNGADVNKKNIYGRSALLDALKNSEVNINVIKLLLSRGASIYVRDKVGTTPLHEAAANIRCPLNVIQLLVENKAKLNDRNKFGETPMLIALFCASSDVRKFLFNSRALVSLPCSWKYPVNCALLKYNNRNRLSTLNFVTMKSIIKYSLLDKASCKVKDLSNNGLFRHGTKQFTFACIRELNRMHLEYLTESLTLHRLICCRSRPLAGKWKDMNWDIKHLLCVLSEYKYPIYDKVIRDTIKREVMLKKLTDYLVYSVRKATGAIYVLDDHSMCHVTCYLHDETLLNLLLAFHESCHSSNKMTILGKRSKGKARCPTPTTKAIFGKRFKCCATKFPSKKQKN